MAQMDMNAADSKVNTNTQSLDNPGFDQMAKGLKGAIEEFSASQTPETWDSILSAFKPVGEYGLRAWNSTTGFVRRHPVQTAVGVAALGFLVATVLKPTAAPRAEDGRQY